MRVPPGRRPSVLPWSHGCIPVKVDCVEFALETNHDSGDRGRRPRGGARMIPARPSLASRPPRLTQPQRLRAQLRYPQPSAHTPPTPDLNDQRLRAQLRHPQPSAHTPPTPDLNEQRLRAQLRYPQPSAHEPSWSRRRCPRPSVCRRQWWGSRAAGSGRRRPGGESPRGSGVGKDLAGDHRQAVDVVDVGRQEPDLGEGGVADVGS